MSPTDAAAKIAAYFRDKNLETTRLKAARKHALSFSSASDRASKYLEFLMEAADKKLNT
jgi:hypothetical protein